MVKSQHCEYIPVPDGVGQVRRAGKQFELEAGGLFI
jgi:hypothetical protein